MTSQAQKAKFKGFILAAGKGQRLLPLTKHQPKPLLTFAGIPLLYYAQKRLVDLGISHVMINAHYHWEEIVKATAFNPFGLEIFLSLEKEKILGTGGAYPPVQAVRDGADLVAINGDIITDFPIKDLLTAHSREKPFASMALLPKPHPGETKIWCLGDRVVAFGGEESPCSGATAHGFACIQILSDAFLQKIPSNEENSIMTFYKKALAETRPIRAVIRDAFWFDLGTPQSYHEAHMQLLKRWHQRPFSEDYDPLNVIALHRLFKRTFKFVATEDRIGSTHILGPSLVAQRSSDDSSPLLELGPYVYCGDAVKSEQALTATSSLLLDNSVLKQQGVYTKVIAHADGILRVE